MNLLAKLGLITSTSLAILACGGGSSGGGGTGAATSEISIPFTARANGTEIKCGAQLSGLGSDSASGTIRGFALYIHNVVLINSDGTELPFTLDDNDWQSSGVALLDYQDKLDSCGSDTAKPINNKLIGSVQGELINVDRIRFTVGVPSELNHEDASAAVTPLNRTDLFWSWQSGYKHLRMDVAPDGGVIKPDNSTTTTWNIHLGSTGCEGNPQTGETVSCSANNRPTIELDISDIANQQIVIDYGKLVENSALMSDQGGAPGCMSGPTDLDCPAIFDALGMGLGDNSDPTEGQTVFSVESL
ncbi:MbnP family copper-binding protein [Zhongshania aliphaticivorans]|uniref:MbnP family copper-binding protein n=1 Tax=Zhongshania aliphaticivorans TaxID=1470434 RepID=UPI0012E60A8C|nr:MbnP family copper-binding protein [Zhongshania aliphaticivorans]CAA0115730.1 Uncharacterised protein [Zhongshania aliphaticivorans]